MNLVFRILWFEDQPVIARQRKIRDYLTEKFGLDTEIVKMKGNEELKFENFNRYDLILIDYGLCHDNNGVEKFKIIRSKHSYVDVAFYSTKKKKLIEDLESLNFELIEGAYLLDIENDILFYEKLFYIIDKIVKRSESIENLRGVVLDQTAEFDKSISNLIIHFVEKYSLVNNVNHYIEKKLQENIIASFNKRKEKFEAASCKFSLCTDKSTSVPYLDSSNNARLLNQILDILIKTKIINGNHFSFQSYIDEIITYRNAFAHTCCDDNSILVKNEVVKINEELHKSIREILSKYRSIFNQLEELK